MKVDGLSQFSSNVSAKELWVKAAKRANDVYLGKLFIKLFKPLKKLARIDPRFFHHSSFLTLTSDKKKNEEDNLALLSKHWNQFLVELKRKVGRKVRYFRVIEISEWGSIHYHVLLVNIPYVSQSWISDTWNRIHGAYIVDIRAVRNAEWAVNYILKYMKKGLENVDMMAQLWFMRIRQWSCSRDFLVEILNQLYYTPRNAECLLDTRLTNSNSVVVFLQYIHEIGDDEVPPHTQEREYDLSAEEILYLRSIKDSQQLRKSIAFLAEQWFPPLTPELILRIGSEE